MFLNTLTLVTWMMVLWVPLSEDDLNAYRQRGTAITDAAQALLVRELTAAMQAGGPPTAVAYCHGRAQQVMDSISAATGVQVRRVSDRARNPLDLPQSKAEEATLRLLQTQYDGPSLSIVETEGPQVHYYRPIMIKEPCLACHGTPGETISDETMAVIRDVYPNDRPPGISWETFAGCGILRSRGTPPETDTRGRTRAPGLPPAASHRRPPSPVDTPTAAPARTSA